MKGRLFDWLMSVLEKFLDFINPRNDYGISDNRRRGSLRLLVGIASVSISFLICRFLGETAGGMFIGGLGSLVDLQEVGCVLLLILGAIWLAGILLPLSLSILVVVGIVELILDRGWDDAEKDQRDVIAYAFGIPLIAIILVYYFQFAASVAR